MESSASYRKIIPFRTSKALCLQAQLSYNPAETLRTSLIGRDQKHLFTFLRHPGVQPTNNQAEQSIRFLVIFRKIMFGTRSESRLKTHSILPSLCLPLCYRDDIQENFCKRSSLLTLLQPKPLCIAIQADVSGHERTKLLPTPSCSYFRDALSLMSLSSFSRPDLSTDWVGSHFSRFRPILRLSKLAMSRTDAAWQKSGPAPNDW